MTTLLEYLTIAATIMGIITSSSFFLQARKILKNKSAKDVSEVMFVIIAFGSWIWLAYGIVINSIPLIISNTLGIIGSTTVFLLTLKFQKRKK